MFDPVERDLSEYQRQQACQEACEEYLDLLMEKHGCTLAEAKKMLKEEQDDAKIDAIYQ